MKQKRSHPPKKHKSQKQLAIALSASTPLTKWQKHIAEGIEKYKLCTPGQGVGLLIILLFTFFLPPVTAYDAITPTYFKPPVIPLPMPAPSLAPYPLPKFAHTAMPQPNTNAKAMIVTDYETNAELYANEAATPLPPASLIKLLTALVALDYCKKDTVLQSANLSHLKLDESKMGLHEGERMYFGDLMYGLLLPSGNDAAVTLAAHCTNQEKGFVQLMNEKADALGMTHTDITNPTGQDEAGNITTAHDLAILARAAMNNPLIAEIVKTPYRKVFDVDGTYSHALVNTNVLLRQDKSVLGVKTGTTDNAKQNLIMLFTLPTGQKIFVVVLGSNDRFQEAINLRRWVLAYFVWKYPAPLPFYYQ